jgi:hypothetical protein
MNNQTQNYANHRRLHPLYHYVLSLLTTFLFVASLIIFVRTVQSGNGVFPAFIFVVISLMFIILFLLIRSYPLKAQDRAMRAEENLRHYVLTQRMLDPRLTMKQIVALRFASDAEFPSLCQRAVKEQLSPDDIKKSIQQWRGDDYRI